MARSKYENHVLRTYVDANTGEVIKQDEFVKIVGKRKLNGFRLVYLDNVLSLLTKFNTIREAYIGIDIISRVSMGNNYEVVFNINEVAKYYGVKSWVARRVLATLKNEGVLMGCRGKYMYNPFFIIPRYMSDDMVGAMQNRWKELYGDYEIQPTDLPPRSRIGHITPEEAAGRSMNSPV